VASSTTGSTSTYFTRDANGRLISILVGGIGGTRYYAYYNGAGSVAGMFSTSGSNVASYSYDPYGNTTATGSEASANPFRFEGGYFDSSTGYYKFGTRYYSPGNTSWTQEDSIAGTIQNPSTVNRYPYVGDDPINESDPSGYCSFFDCIGEAYDDINIGLNDAYYYVEVNGILNFITEADACEEGAAANISEDPLTAFVGCLEGLGGNLSTSS
jgi:RHS repeat-associated protein